MLNLKENGVKMFLLLILKLYFNGNLEKKNFFLNNKILQLIN
jgi:hypothetical protein